MLIIRFITSGALLLQTKCFSGIYYSIITLKSIQNQSRHMHRNPVRVVLCVAGALIPKHSDWKKVYGFYKVVPNLYCLLISDITNKDVEVKNRILFHHCIKRVVTML